MSGPQVAPARHILPAMTPPADPALATDWLGLCRRAAAGARDALERRPLPADRAATAGRGMGGDMALVIDREAEDAVFAELEALGIPLTAISEERGELLLSGGGPVHVVVDPVDGSRNARRGCPATPFRSRSRPGRGWRCTRGLRERPRHGRGVVGPERAGRRLRRRAGAGKRNGDLELLGLETAKPVLVAENAEALAATGAARLRCVGSIALSLCYVAGGRLDALVCLGASRSVDSAAGQLIAREAGAAVAFPDAGADWRRTGLSLDMRSRVLAAAGPDLLERLVDIGAA